MTARPYWHWVLAAGLVAWSVTTTIQWLVPAPLGHDEAQYALAARDVLDGVEPRWFYLSPGMNVLAVPGIMLGQSEIALRLVPFISALAFILTVAVLAYRTLGGATAAWTVALLAGCRPLLQRATELLSDLPAAGCLLLGMWVLAKELGRDEGPRWRLMATAPLMAAALYVRYGSCLPIAIIGVAALGVWWRAILRRPLPVIATALLFVLLLVPHALTARHVTGSILGILLASKEVPGGSFGDGLITYVTANPFKYYGMVAPFVMVAGLFAILRIRERFTVFLWIVAVGDIVAMGLATPAQPRYIFLGTTLLVMLGVDVLRRLVEPRSHQVRRIAAVGSLVVIASSWTTVARQALSYPKMSRTKLATMFQAFELVRRDAAGKPCQVVTRHTTQLEWYVGCLGAWDPPLDAIERGDAVYFLRDDTGGDQPDLEKMPPVRRTVLESPTILLVRLQKP